MSKRTSIQWVHSSVNLQMGCDGCELWNKTKRVCYAGILIDGEGNRPGFKGRKGYPPSFAEPTIFPERLDPALAWGEPTEAEKTDKPWIPEGYPRLIFLNDMGDTFSKKLPLDWMAPFLPRIAESPHQWLILTKRPSRMEEFSRSHPFPKNVWLGTSVTSEQTTSRLDTLRKVQGGGPKFVSFEPLWGPIDVAHFDGFDWAIFGGESGKDATPLNVDWILGGILACRNAGIAAFVKQLGAQPVQRVDSPMCDLHPLKDSHGGDWSEWPEDLRVRQYPELEPAGLL